MNEISNNEKKRINKVKIAKFILHKGETSKPEIANVLGISMPTVLQNIKELIADEIVEEVGQYQSTGGRKAKALSIVDKVKYSVGIDITVNHISYVMIDLKGKLILKNRIRKIFNNTPNYYEFLANNLEVFLRESEVSCSKILGVGISLPGIIDKSNQMLIKSHILNMSNVSLKNISELIKYDVCFENDANSAAMAELNYLNRNAIYLSLSNTVGGSIYISNEIYLGDNYRSAEFGHIIINPDGEKCYCGKNGCVDTYCSANVLSKYTDYSLEEFFKKLELRDEKIVEVWEKYLDYLAITVTNLRMSFDCDIVLGGYVGGYLSKYITELNRKVLKYNKFENNTTYLKTCKFETETSAIGIAMNFVEQYFETLN